MNSIPAWVRTLRSLWDIWDVRVLLLISLTLQTILFIFGNRRKYMTSVGIRIMIWLAYLTADGVATFGLGKLSDTQPDLESTSVPYSAVLQAIWAALLLVHLGGPDTITAYSLEDNQLWLRHLLDLVAQVFGAIYVILLSWRNDTLLSILTIPVFMVGVIKYAERTWVLMLLGRNEQSHYSAPVVVAPDWEVYTSYPDGEALMQASNYLHYNQPFSNLEPNITSRFPPFYIDCFKSWDALEIVMGLKYDFVYTKTSLTYSKKGFILRAITFSCTVAILVCFFFIIIFKEGKEKHYSIVDITVTAILLVGAFFLEIYAVTVVLSSDWTMLWLIKHHKQDKLVIPLLFQIFPWLFSIHKKSRWSNSMGQIELLSFCLKQNKPVTRGLIRVVSLLPIIDKEKLDEYSHTTRLNHVPQHLKEMITQFVWSTNGPKYLTGEKALADHNLPDELQEFTKKVLDIRIIIWHVATELCEFHAKDHQSNTTTSFFDNSIEASSSLSTPAENKHRKTCKLLSNYMLFLLVTYPSMLRIPSWDSKFRSTSYVLKSHILPKNHLDKSRASPNLQSFPDSCKDDRIMGDGFKIAEFLMKNGDKKWEILTSVWVEMLCSAAKECDHNTHAQQLHRGGELLTLVWLLIAYLKRP